MMIKAAILAATVIVSAIFGVWLIAAPSRERRAIEHEQDALLQDIEREIYAVFEEVVEDELPCTSEMSDETCEVDSETEINETEIDAENTELSPQYSPTPAIEPLPADAFPSFIYGIGILEIEAIDLRLPIAEGVDYDTLRIAPGRVPQTAHVGEIGNAVIAGHRNYAHGSMFNRLGELEIGDVVSFQSRRGERMTFEVFEIAVIEPHDQIAFIQPANASIITLYTCTPIRTATHRLLVRAQKIETEEFSL